MGEIKIREAYCVELDRVISIDTARIEYFAQTIEIGKRKKFSFLCSNIECRHSQIEGVKVTGVNYSILRKVDNNGNVISKVAHYRRNTAHLANCSWVVINDYMNSEKQHAGETKEEYANRRIVNKTHYFIDVYSPNEGSNQSKEAVLVKLSPFKKSNPASSPVKVNESKLQRPALTTTSVLSRLVESWTEARDVLSKSEFAALTFTVNNKKTSLKRYFKQLKYAIVDNHSGVTYGGAKLIQRYGKGFKLEFFDQIEQKKIFVYCSNELMQKSRNSNYIDELLKHTNCYFKIYLINQHLEKNNISYTYEISNLSNLDISMVSKQ